MGRADNGPGRRPSPRRSSPHARTAPPCRRGAARRSRGAPSSPDRSPSPSPTSPATRGRDDLSRRPSPRCCRHRSSQRLDWSRAGATPAATGRAGRSEPSPGPASGPRRSRSSSEACSLAPPARDRRLSAAIGLDPLGVARRPERRYRSLRGSELCADLRAQGTHVGAERVEEQLVSAEDVAGLLRRLAVRRDPPAVTSRAPPGG